MAIPFSAQNRKSEYVIAVGDLFLPHRVFQLEIKAVGRSHTAMRRNCAAKHHRAIGNAAATQARQQLLGLQHRTDRALLVTRPVSLDRGIGTDNQTIPMRRYIVESPERPSDRLVTHLLR